MFCCSTTTAMAGSIFISPIRRRVEMALQGKKAKSALYRNNHDGTFTDVTDKAGVGYPCWAMGGAVGDYNNDGWPDMLITCEEGMVLYRNNGDGTFTDVTKQAHLTDPRWSTGAAFADYDGDGFVDSDGFALRGVRSQSSSAVRCGRHVPLSWDPGAVRTAWHERVWATASITTTATERLRTFRRRPGVDDARGYYGLGVAWSDFNDDGRPDLFVADDSTPNYLYRNDGNGHFTDVSYISGTAVSSDGGEMAGMGVAVCDFNHSGRFSIHMTNFEDQSNSLYRNDGSMAFTDVAYAAGIGSDYDSVSWAGGQAVSISTTTAGLICSW